MRETKFWTWHMAAGVVILLLLGQHMVIMHLGSITHWFAPMGGSCCVTMCGRGSSICRCSSSVDPWQAAHRPRCGASSARSGGGSWWQLTHSPCIASM